MFDEALCSPAGVSAARVRLRKSRPRPAGQRRLRRLLPDGVQQTPGLCCNAQSLFSRKRKTRELKRTQSRSHPPPNQDNSLWVKRGGLSLTSLSLTVTVVVPDSPPRCPPMSLACRSTRYWSWVSLSMSGTAVRRIPAEQTRPLASKTYRI